MYSSIRLSGTKFANLTASSTMRAYDGSVIMLEVTRDIRGDMHLKQKEVRPVPGQESWPGEIRIDIW